MQQRVWDACFGADSSSLIRKSMTMLTTSQSLKALIDYARCRILERNSCSFK